MRIPSVPDAKRLRQQVKSYVRARNVEWGLILFGDGPPHIPNGLWFLPDRILVECKNWTTRVGSAEVSWFDAKLRRRGPSGRFGILFAASGVTGDPNDHTAAKDVIDQALADGREIIVITSDDLISLTSSDDLVQLLKIKLTRLAAGMSYG